MSSAWQSQSSVSKIEFQVCHGHLIGPHSSRITAAPGAKGRDIKLLGLVLWLLIYR